MGQKLETTLLSRNLYRQHEQFSFPFSLLFLVKKTLEGLAYKRRNKSFRPSIVICSSQFSPMAWRHICGKLYETCAILVMVSSSHSADNPVGSTTWLRAANSLNSATPSG